MASLKCLGAMFSVASRAMGKSKPEPSFRNVGGGQVDCYALTIRKFEATISQCGPDALTAFFYSIVGEAHYVEVLHARGTYDLNLHEVGVDSVHGGTDGFEEHFFRPVAKTRFV
jgi:hypothetical protein